MGRALQLAELGRGHTAPNPLVGAVLVKEGRIVGEGYHAQAGAPHAEVMALAAAGTAACGATLYVSLEPCNHQGRTPPCAPLVRERGVSRVVAATRDPNPIAQGGLDYLAAQGINVATGLLAEEAQEQNWLFFHGLKHQRPLVLWKTGLSADGQISSAPGQKTQITGLEAQAVAHGYRQALGAVAVGIGTVLADDPALTVREPDYRAFPWLLWPPAPHDPLKVIFDRQARTPLNARVLDGKTLIFCEETAPRSRRAALQERGAEVVALVEVEPRRALAELWARGIDGVLLEGGAHLAASFWEQDLVDALSLFVAPRIFGLGQPALANGLESVRNLVWQEPELVGSDLWLRGRVVR